MHLPRSLTARVLVGAVLWTLGLLLVASAVLAAVIEHQGPAAWMIHGALAHTAIVVVLSLGLLAAGAWQVRRGLSEVTRLRPRLMDVRRGRSARVEGRYPSEVQPVVDDLNDLLDERERMVRRAQAKAGDLAHGLKTPLAILTQDVDRAASLGDAALAASLLQQTTRMRRHIDYHLAQARAVGASAAASITPVEEAVSALATTLARLHAERALVIDVRVPADAAVRCEREGLDEMVGNLMDNACKWARGRVVASATLVATDVVLLVEDDGPGLGPAVDETVLGRGIRLDETVPGSGLGLAIVRDLAGLYGGHLRLARSPLGGVAAYLTLPRAHAQEPAR